MSNAQITRDVLDELLWDDRLDASRVEVTADEGTVVLGGTDDYSHEKWNAGEDANRVVGVTNLVNEIAVGTAARTVSPNQGRGPASERAAWSGSAVCAGSRSTRSPTCVDIAT